MEEDDCREFEYCIWAESECLFVDDNDDEEEDFEDCAELTQDECTMSEFCDWTIVTTPNGVFETCIESNDWNDDGGWDDGGNNIVCSTNAKKRFDSIYGMDAIISRYSAIYDG